MLPSRIVCGSWVLLLLAVLLAVVRHGASFGGQGLVCSQMAGMKTGPLKAKVQSLRSGPAFRTAPGVLRSRGTGMPLAPGGMPLLLREEWRMGSVALRTASSSDSEKAEEDETTKWRKKRAIERLERAGRELDEAETADPVDPLRVAKAEFGVAQAELKAAPEGEKAGLQVQVAKAELGVAEAKRDAASEEEKAGLQVSVAEAKVGVAEAKWQAAPEDEKGVLLETLVMARDAVNKAQEHLFDTAAADPKQASVQGTELAIKLVRGALMSACQREGGCECVASMGSRRSFSIDLNVIVGRHARMQDANNRALFLERESQMSRLSGLIEERQNRTDWTHDKKHNDLFVVSNSPGQGKSVFLAKSGEMLTQEGGALSGAAVLPFTYNSGMGEDVTGISMKAAVMLRAIYGGLMSSRSEGCDYVAWEAFVRFIRQQRSTLPGVEGITLNEWLEAARELMGLDRGASKSSKLLLLADEVAKVRKTEGTGWHSQEEASEEVYTIVGQVLDLSPFNNVVISSLSPEYAKQKATRSNRRIVTDGMVMSPLSLTNPMVLDTFRALLGDLNDTERYACDVALRLTGGHPRGLEIVIENLKRNRNLLCTDWRVLTQRVAVWLQSGRGLTFSKTPSFEFLEAITTCEQLPQGLTRLRGHLLFDEMSNGESFTLSDAVEEGLVHVLHSDGVKIVVDLLPTHLSEAVRRLSVREDVANLANWSTVWTTHGLSLSPLEWHIVLLRDCYTGLEQESRDMLEFKPADAAELVALWSVIRAIGLGNVHAVLGEGSCGYTTGRHDVVFESHQIRPNPGSKQASKDFFNRVAAVGVEESEKWTVLLPPLRWPHVDFYVVSPGGGTEKRIITGVSVKSCAGDSETEQLRKLGKDASSAKCEGSNGVIVDRFAAFLGFSSCLSDIDQGAEETREIDKIFRPSDLSDFVPNSIMALSVLSHSEELVPSGDDAEEKGWSKSDRDADDSAETRGKLK